MAYVIINPHSNGNLSDRYRVVEASDWTAYVNGARPSVAFAGQFDNYYEAAKLRARLNGVDPTAGPDLKENLEEQIQEAYRNGPSDKYEDLKELKRDLFPNG